MMLIDQELCVTKDIVGHLNDPEFWDVKIVGSDGVIPVNKTILSMRSQYFRSMFSSNNFVESQAGIRAPIIGPFSAWKPPIPYAIKNQRRASKDPSL